jgi:hypothetical protein
VIICHLVPSILIQPFASISEGLAAIWAMSSEVHFSRTQEETMLKFWLLSFAFVSYRILARSLELSIYCLQGETMLIFSLCLLVRGHRQEIVVPFLGSTGLNWLYSLPDRIIQISATYITNPMDTYSLHEVCSLHDGPSRNHTRTGLWLVQVQVLLECLCT